MESIAGQKGFLRSSRKWMKPMSGNSRSRVVSPVYLLSRSPAQFPPTTRLTYQPSYQGRNLRDACQRLIHGSYPKRWIVCRTIEFTVESSISAAKKRDDRNTGQGLPEMSNQLASFIPRFPWPITTNPTCRSERSRFRAACDPRTVTTGCPRNWRMSLRADKRLGRNSTCTIALIVFPNACPPEWKQSCAETRRNLGSFR